MFLMKRKCPERTSRTYLETGSLESSQSQIELPWEHDVILRIMLTDFRLEFGGRVIFGTAAKG
jgi:hypothetical protein